MTIDVHKAREETPGCKNVIHLNNAGASLMPKSVIEAVQTYFFLESHWGGYEAYHIAEQRINNFYHAVSQLLNCDPMEVAYSENATRAWDMIFYSLSFKKGDKIITSSAEYASNYLAFLQIAQKTGAVIEVIKNDSYGQLSLEDLERKIDKNAKLISITHIPTNGGLINPVVEVGKIAKAHNIFYLLDATQSVGQMPVSVKEIGCDALCATGRKFLRGPRGSGFLYLSKKYLDLLEPPFAELQGADWIDQSHFKWKSDAKKFETWEVNFGNKIGIATAIDYALKWGLDSIFERITKLAIYLRKKLSEVKGITMQDLGEKKCGIITFTSLSKTPQEIQKFFYEKNINVSISLAQYARLDMDPRKLSSLVRVSLHYYNTEDEIDRFCSELSTFQ